MFIKIVLFMILFHIIDEFVLQYDKLLLRLMKKSLWKDYYTGNKKVIR